MIPISFKLVSFRTITDEIELHVWTDHAAFSQDHIHRVMWETNWCMILSTLYSLTHYRDGTTVADTY